MLSLWKTKQYNYYERYSYSQQLTFFIIEECNLSHYLNTEYLRQVIQYCLYYYREKDFSNKTL